MNLIKYAALETDLNKSGGASSKINLISEIEKNITINQSPTPFLVSTGMTFLDYQLDISQGSKLEITFQPSSYKAGYNSVSNGNLDNSLYPVCACNIVAPHTSLGDPEYKLTIDVLISDTFYDSIEGGLHAEYTTYQDKKIISTMSRDSTDIPDYTNYYDSYSDYMYSPHFLKSVRLILGDPSTPNKYKYIWEMNFRDNT